VAFRGDEAKYYEGWNIGDIKQLKAYTSTSVSSDVAQAFKDEVQGSGRASIMLEINVPKGTRGLYIGDNTGYDEKEAELLLGRGLYFKVVGRKGDILKLEAVNE
jgi:hypothetical protein